MSSISVGINVFSCSFSLPTKSLTLATWHSLVIYIPLQYTYAVISILILNVVVSPVLFLCRDRTPVMRELVVVFDTVLDLTVIALMSRILVKQVDLEKPVYLLGESFPSIPAGMLLLCLCLGYYFGVFVVGYFFFLMFFLACFSAFLLIVYVVLTGVVWPCFLVLWRCFTLNVGFIRMVVEHKLQHEEDERQQEVRDLHRKNTIECKPGFFSACVYFSIHMVTLTLFFIFCCC